MTSTLKEQPAKVKELPSPHEVRPTPVDVNAVFQCIGDNPLNENMKPLQSF